MFDTCPIHGELNGMGGERLFPFTGTVTLTELHLV